MSGNGPRIDHIIIAAKDVNKAADHILKTYGLAGYQGGKHSGGWGTENFIIPLGEGYLEIAAIFNEEEARGCDWGRLIKASEERVTEEHPWTLVTFCVEVPEGAQAASERLGQESARMLRLLPSGAQLRWSVGAMSKFDAPGRNPKPFFITWDDPQFRPDKRPAEHKVRPAGFDYVELSGDEAAMKAWIGADLPLRWAEGPPAILSVGIKTDSGTIVLK